MIQRIQSLYLLIAALAAFLGVLFFPIFSTMLFAKIGMVISFVLSFVAIFLYKKRKMQRILGRLNIMVVNFYPLYICFFGVPESAITFVLLPCVISLFLILAGKSIKKDEILIKSSDRIR